MEEINIPILSQGKYIGNNHKNEAVWDLIGPVNEENGTCKAEGGLSYLYWPFFLEMGSNKFKHTLTLSLKRTILYDSSESDIPKYN